jgi:hypothetical protein
MARIGRPRKPARERLDTIIRFGVTPEVARALREQRRNGEILNETARRIFHKALGNEALGNGARAEQAA